MTRSIKKTSTYLFSFQPICLIFCFLIGTCTSTDYNGYPKTVTLSSQGEEIEINGNNPALLGFLNNKKQNAETECIFSDENSTTYSCEWLTVTLLKKNPKITLSAEPNNTGKIRELELGLMFPPDEECTIKVRQEK